MLKCRTCSVSLFPEEERMKLCGNCAVLFALALVWCVAVVAALLI